jgi:hypothetical protein
VSTDHLDYIFGARTHPMNAWHNHMPPINLISLGAAKIDKPSGVKFDQDKPRVDLLDPLALEGLAAVLTFGANKYAANNWRGGISYSRLTAAMLRHLFAFMRGEDIDPESGLPHIDHLGCCWMFLSYHSKVNKHLDDRYKHAE